jgi:hypothetical protein
MHGFRDVSCCGTHFDGEHTLANQFAGASADDPDAEYSLCFRLDDQFG